MMERLVALSDCQLPSWDNIVIEESGWSFKQQGIVENNVKFNLWKKEITFDMTKKNEQIRSQMSNVEDGSSNEKSRKKKI